MCTLSIIPLPEPAHGVRGGFRLVTNRDESRRRPHALPPAIRELPGAPGARAAQAAWPTDPVGGGTWIAATDRGLVLSIINVNLVPPPQMPPSEELESRGVIIPSLIGAMSEATEAPSALARLDLDSFAPFRLLAVDANSIVESRWDRARLSSRRSPLTRACFVSSGLGDHRVQERLALFDSWFGAEPPTPARQDAFHAHSWPDRPEVSVMMSRADARTVSRTVVEVSGVAGARAPLVVMRYVDDSGERSLTVGGAAARAAPAALAGRSRC